MMNAPMQGTLTTPVPPPDIPTLRRCDIVIEDQVTIPAWVNDLESYRRWARSGGYPDHGWYSFLHGEIWVDLSKEELFSHNFIRAEYMVVLGTQVRAVRGGYFVGARMLLSHPGADLATEPDGLFISWEAIKSGRLKLAGEESEDYRELEGTPDMVLEIISQTSVRKDTQVLRDLYWRAGIPEYWLVDVRSGEPFFDILQHTAEGYVSAPAQDGWLISGVFGQAFRLVRHTDPLGHPKYRLEMRPTAGTGPRGPEGRG